MNLYSLLVVSFSLLIFAACASNRVDLAFDGKLGYSEEIKVTVEYCQSCHLHRDFNSEQHLTEKPILYSEDRYRKANTCKACHMIKRNFWNDIIRTTHLPKGRLVAK